MQEAAMRRKPIGDALPAVRLTPESNKPPVSLTVLPKPEPDQKPKFDRVAYQREYMRKRRAARKA